MSADETKTKIRAAMYVRMSTDHQKYSTENQADAIQEYADRHGMEIVKKYADDGKSGLTLEGRDALKQMIDDVLSGQADYKAILSLDVTRWGRFQDVDESAYYEYICRRAGISVHYVSEQFQNDGSPISNIVKSVKRSMAAEYSRELSSKVFTGQCKLIEKGFRQGGAAGFGLRRMLVDEHGNPKGELKRGEHKSLQTDRVILVPGPDEEIEIVRWMYKAFTEDRMLEGAIAISLNQRGIMTDLDRSWTRGTVHEVLTNEKYIGNNVFNRVSFKLKMRRVVNSPEMWVRSEGVFEGIVEPAQFYTAQGMIRERSRKISNDDMLAKLSALRERKGWLSGLVIDEADDMPSSSAYAHRFGSLIRAYELIGYTPDKDYSYIEINRQLRKMYPSVIEGVVKRIHELGGHVSQDLKSEFLIINNEIKVSLVIARCQQTSAGNYRWNINLDTGLRPDISLIIRMDANNLKPLDYYLLPALDVENPTIRLAEDNHIALDAYRFDDLEPFFQLTERVAILEAA